MSFRLKRLEHGSYVYLVKDVGWDTTTLVKNASDWPTEQAAIVAGKSTWTDWMVECDPGDRERFASMVEAVNELLCKLKPTPK